MPKQQLNKILKFLLIYVDNISYFENYNLSTVKSPVNASILRKLLEDSNYDRNEIEFLTDGFS